MIPKNISTVEETMTILDKREKLNILLPFRLITFGLAEEAYETNG